MPWCTDCNRFYTQSTLNRDGTCPDGHQAAPLPPPGLAATAGAESIGDEASASDETSASDEKTAPWHFWLMVAALTIYLGWRLIQGVMWAIGKL